MSSNGIVKSSIITFVKISFMPRQSVERNQLNMRMSDELRKAIDAKRIELANTLGVIPSRSDVVRLALEGYLNMDLSKTEGDRRKMSWDERYGEK